MPAPQPRLIYNDDGSNFLYSWDDLTLADLRAYLERLRGTQVDMVAFCVAFGGYVAYYDSQVAEGLGTGFTWGADVRVTRAARNLRQLDAAGGYLATTFGLLAEMGIPALASIRMNDAHMSGDPVGPCAGRFWMNHPQWKLGEPYGYYSSCLDYAVPGVREYLRQLVLEVMDRYPDVAGLELDGMRSPYFFRDGTGREQAPIMTAFLRQIRADLDRLAAARGRERYQLRLTVPRSPELALESGMDVAAWEAEGLVDGIAPGCYNTDFQLPIEAWKAHLPGGTPVHGYINCSPGSAQYLSVEDYRGAAANGLQAGADGVYLFNFPCLDELSRLLPCDPAAGAFPIPEFKAQGWHDDLSRDPQVLSELADAEGLAHRDKRFLFCVERAGYRHQVQERVRIARLEPAPALFEFRCFEDYAAASALELEWKLVGVARQDEFAFALNGRPLPAEALAVQYSASGRDARLHPAPLEPYFHYRLTVDPTWLARGANTLETTLVAGAPWLAGEVELRELKVTVRYPAK